MSFIQEHLDRALANDRWKLQFPDATVLHLPAIQSDHCPILLRTTARHKNLVRPFKFETMWTEHEETELVIKDAWCRGYSLLSKIKNTKLALKKWNKDAFSHVQTRISDLKKDIAILQTKQYDGDTTYAEQTKQWELDTLLKREEMLWRDKAKVKWLGEGDANTHFFHISTIVHRRYNSINQILNSSNLWLTDWSDIGEEFRKFYSTLFTSSCPSFPSDMQGLIQPSITEDQNVMLVAVPAAIDIYHAVSSMGSFKSPGPDGLTVIFFKRYWSTVGAAVIKTVQDFFQSRQMPSSLNHTFLTLIPKVTHASKVDQFRPISLCNVIFKTVTKILATRIRGLLENVIHPSQVAFVPNRSIGDNSIINHEIMQYLNTKQGKQGYMAIKIDLAKAYDRVEWATLLHILKLLGASEQFCELIKI